MRGRRGLGEGREVEGFLGTVFDIDQPCGLWTADAITKVVLRHF
jgi:hypothetical protein